MDTRKCTKCGIEKPLFGCGKELMAFSRGWGPFGRKTVCKECEKEARQLMKERGPSNRAKEILTKRALSVWEAGYATNEIIMHFEGCVFSVIRVGASVEVSYVN